jgi:uncharacterized protein YukE
MAHRVDTAMVSRLARRRSRLVMIAVAACMAAVLLSACGGSSKPSYCSSVSNLEKSVQDLKNVNVVSSGTSGLKSALQKVESSAKSVISSAKSDFPSETSAVSSSVDALTTSVNGLSGPPSTGQIAQIAQQAGAAVNAVKSFVDSTKSKCG